MSAVFLIAFLILMYGVFKPFRGFKRWQFGLAAFLAFMMIGVFAPKDEAVGERGKAAQGNEASAQTGKTRSELEALERKNAGQIASLKAEVAKLPANDVDGNLRIYRQLSELAPLNGAFSAKAAEYQRRAEVRSRYEVHPEEALSVEDFDWHAGGFGSVMEISRLTVRNDAPFPIKDFKLHCVHTANSGTEIDENTRVQFEIVPANSTRTFRNINMGFISSQVAASSCEITSASRA